MAGRKGLYTFQALPRRTVQNGAQRLLQSRARTQGKRSWVAARLARRMPPGRHARAKTAPGDTRWAHRLRLLLTHVGTGGGHLPPQDAQGACCSPASGSGLNPETATPHPQPVFPRQAHHYPQNPPLHPGPARLSHHQPAPQSLAAERFQLGQHDWFTLHRRRSGQTMYMPHINSGFPR